ncbi:hypothetical protein OIU78_020144 [Salix suchowensis]|nr:hypothetical protein OIU78_020144 [Salix suchowensis]
MLRPQNLKLNLQLRLRPRRL